MEPLVDKSILSDLLGIKPKRLPEFISDNVELIVVEWEMFAQSLNTSSTQMAPLTLRDHVDQILDFIVEDIKSSQTFEEQVNKSKGKKEKSSIFTAAEIHTALRMAGGFDVEQIASEYRALRASITKLWVRTNPIMDSEDASDLIRFNESIDQSLGESISFYKKETISLKDSFAETITKDIVGPLTAINFSTELIFKASNLTENQIFIVKEILKNVGYISEIIDDVFGDTCR